MCFSSSIRKFKGLQLAACSLLLAVTASSRAATLVDNFLTPQQVTVLGSGTASSSVNGAGVLGGERDVSATVVSGLGIDVDINQSGLQLLAFSQKALTDGSAAITWDGADGSNALNATGLGGIDLTNGSGTGKFVLNDITDDLPVEVKLWAYTDAANFSTHTLNLPGGIFAPTDFEIPYASFVVGGGTGADFTNIGALQMSFDSLGVSSVDVSLASIEAVPEPSTLSLLGLGLVGVIRLGIRRRRN